jgi:hypothetical protein
VRPISLPQKGYISIKIEEISTFFGFRRICLWKKPLIRKKSAAGGRTPAAASSMFGGALS